MRLSARAGVHRTGSAPGPSAQLRCCGQPTRAAQAAPQPISFSAIVSAGRDLLSAPLPVVDASVVVDWVAPGSDPTSPAARALTRLAGSGAQLLGPGLLMEEVSNALLTGIRRRRWSGAQADTAFELLRDLPVALIDEPRDLARAWDLSRRYDNHPVYDMLYVAVAERARTQLVTADDRLLTRLAATNLVIAADQVQ